MKTVFILGAGASAEAGVPMMADFLDSAWDIMRYGDKWLGEARVDFERIKNVHKQLQGIHIKSFLDLNNIETLFGAIELGQIISKLGALDEKKIRTLIDSIRIFISKTIEVRMIFGSLPNDNINTPEPYGAFVDNICKKQDAAKMKNVEHDYSFLTFNYDVTLDHAFKFHSLPINYCLDPTLTTGYKYLKLHGSINWFEGLDDKVYFFHPNEFKFLPGHISSPDVRKVTKYHINLNETIRNAERDGIIKSRSPLIVPPVWDKIKYQKKLASIWQRAAEELSSANNLVIIGYSLPDTDQFFRYLFALGSQSDVLIDQVIIVNPEQPVEGKYLAEERFRAMFGGSIQARIKMIRKPFREAITEIFTTLPT